MSALSTDDPQDQAALDARYQAMAARERLLPIKVTGFYRAKIDAEVAALGHRRGPLFRTVHPTPERFDPAAAGEVADWVDDRSNMPVHGSDAIIHKYPDRVLFMPTSTCAAHCQYCFRQDVLSEAHAGGRTAALREFDRLTGYLDDHPEVSEVILSGGDPMTLPLRDLAPILRGLKSRRSIRSIRIHTRTPIFSPKVFSDEGKLDLLAEVDARLVLHVVHPHEICDDVRTVLSGLRRRDVRLYNHFPMLRGVNDHVDVVRRLIERLDDERVRTLSVYVPEPIRHSAPFRVGLARFFAIQDALVAGAPSWVNAVRFTLDSPLGKVRREHIVDWDAAGGRVTFAREGRRFVYPDFPAERDLPGDPEIMLWQDRAAGR